MENCCPDGALGKMSYKLTAKISPFITFCEGTENVEKDFKVFYKFYKKNYSQYLPSSRKTNILVLSCGHGYFLNLLKKEGYLNVLGIDNDKEKINYARKKGFNCQRDNSFEFLKKNKATFDLIISEQELNHLIKEEILTFFKLCFSHLKKGGRLLVHSINSANPLTAPDAIGQNFDHYSFFTENSLRQVFNYAHFKNIEVIPLDYYIFYLNPLNYPAKLLTLFLHSTFRILFKLYGKPDEIFTKKIAAIGTKE